MPERMSSAEVAVQPRPSGRKRRLFSAISGVGQPAKLQMIRGHDAQPDAVQKQLRVETSVGLAELQQVERREITRCVVVVKEPGTWV